MSVVWLQPDCNMQGLMYNPVIMQASCTVYSLVSFCNGENEADLQPVLFPFSSPLVSEDFDADILLAMNQGGKTASLIGLLGSLPGGIGTLVDVIQLLATMEKTLNSQMTAAGSDKCESADADADGTRSSDQPSLLGPPLSVSSKSPSIQALSRLYQFAFNHVLASHIQAQLLQRLTMPVCEEPVPPEARIPISSLGGIVSLFDLPLVRPLVTKSSLKTAPEPSFSSSQSAAQQTSAPFNAVATTGDSILRHAPGPRLPGPPTNSAVPAAPVVRPGPPRAPAVRLFTGRNSAGAGNWPRPPCGNVRPVMTGQDGEQNQWSSGWMDGGNSKLESNRQRNNETAGNVYQRQQWNSGPETIQSDWTSYSGPPNMRATTTAINSAKRPHKPPASQSTFPSVHGRPPQVCKQFVVYDRKFAYNVQFCFNSWSVLHIMLVTDVIMHIILHTAYMAGPPYTTVICKLFAAVVLSDEVFQPYNVIVMVIAISE